MTLGMIYIAEICIEQNIFRIYDKEQLFVVESTNVFESDMDWRIVFGIFSLHRVDLEILDCYGYL